MSIDNQKTAAATGCSPVQSHYQTEEDSDPKAKASYEDVVANGTLFMETLEELHKSIGTKFMVPTIGGKPLDLHCLFVEVTRRGGLQKVIGDRKWKEVTSAFTFPATHTHVTFMLRKHYIALLQMYEQLYFFRKGDSKHTSNEHCSLRVGSTVKGKINGKFENGYIVTADFGFEIFTGVLYHVPPLQPPDPDHSTLPSKRHGQKRSRKGTDPTNLKLDTGKGSRKKTAHLTLKSGMGKGSMKETDPSTLKSDRGNRSMKETDHSNIKLDTEGYNGFFAEHYSKLRPLYSGKETVIIKHIISIWNNLTESEKEVYRKMDKERHEAGM